MSDDLAALQFHHLSDVTRSPSGVARRCSQKRGVTVEGEVPGAVPADELVGSTLATFLEEPRQLFLPAQCTAGLVEHSRRERSLHHRVVDVEVEQPSHVPGPCPKVPRLEDEARVICTGCCRHALDGRSPGRRTLDAAHAPRICTMEPQFADDGVAAFVAHASLGRLDVAEMRAGVAARVQGRARGPDLARVYDVSGAGCPARVYRPDDAVRAPLLVWLHGGGWTIGDVAAFDRVSRRLAAVSGVSVLLLDYRLAPEHPWPAAVDDAVEVISWLAAAPAELAFHASVVGVGGDSAGGTLAALATLRLARELPAIRPDLLALCYPNTDLAGDYPSRAEKGSGFGLDASDTEFFNRQWVPDRTWWSAPGVSPLHSRDLASLPPTIVVTAEHDHLRDEGAAFADRLEDEQVEVTRRCEPGLVHNFLMLDEISPAAASAADRFAADIGGLLRHADAARSSTG